MYVSTLTLCGTCETGYEDARGAANGAIFASFQGVAKETQVGNIYTVIITPLLFGGWGARGECPLRRQNRSPRPKEKATDVGGPKFPNCESSVLTYILRGNGQIPSGAEARDSGPENGPAEAGPFESSYS